MALNVVWQVLQVCENEKNRIPKFWGPFIHPLTPKAKTLLKTGGSKIFEIIGKWY